MRLAWPGCCGRSKGDAPKPGVPGIVALPPPKGNAPKPSSGPSAGADVSASKASCGMCDCLSDNSAEMLSTAVLIMNVLVSCHVTGYFCVRHPEHCPHVHSARLQYMCRIPSITLTR